MTYCRVRLALLIVAALALLARPASGAATMAGESAAARTLPAGITVPDRATGQAAVAAPSPGAAAPSKPAAASSQPPRPPAGSTPGASPSRSRSPVESSVGPGGSAKRTGSAAVALTFDDGPDAVQTPALLDLLRQHGVKATFCLVGFRARDHPDLVRRIAREGHTLCNHSWQHLFDLAQRPVEEIRRDLAATNEAIRAAVPGATIRYFRAPGGHFTPGLVDLVRGWGMKSIYWQVDPRDWDHRLTGSDRDHIARVTAAVQRGTRPGAIVLSHDNKQPTTIEAYRTLLPWLKARFQLIPLPT